MFEALTSRGLSSLLRHPLVLAVTVTMVALTANGAQINLDDGAVDMSADPFFDSTIQRNDFLSSFDQDLGTASFLTQSGPGRDPRIVCYNFETGLQAFNRVRINEIANNDGNGPVSLTVYYYNGDAATAFLDRTYQPVTGLALVQVDGDDTLPSGAVNENSFSRADVANDGYFSLQFDEVQSSGFALVFDTAGANTHYHVREIEAHFGDAVPVPQRVTGLLVDIVDGTVTPGPTRTAPGSEFELAFDGDVFTRTFTTNSGTSDAPQKSRFALSDGGHILSRIRINDIAGNDGNGRMEQITLRVTTSSDPDLNARTYLDVSNLSVELFQGDALPLPNVTVSGNTVEHLDADHDGFYSLTFDPVPGATGFEFEWNNAGGNKHWTIREIEAYAKLDPGLKVDITDGAVLPGPVRTANNIFENAFDGEVGTLTFTTQSGTNVAPQRTLLNLEPGNHALRRVRINAVAGNDGNGRMRQLTVRVTTDTDPDLDLRVYNDVTNLQVLAFEDDSGVPEVSIVDNTIEHLDAFHDGFYSLIFDPVPGATGIEFEWDNDGGSKHWTIREIEAYVSTGGDDPNLIVSAQVNFEAEAAGTLSVPVRNVGNEEDLTISDVQISGAQAEFFSALTFPAQLGPGGEGAIEMEFDPGDAFGDFEAILTIQSNDPSDQELEIRLQVSVPEPPRVPDDVLIDIVEGLLLPGAARTSNNIFENAFDGDPGTMTFTTESGTVAAPQSMYLGLESAQTLSRIRINDVAGNDNNGRMNQITVRVTTEDDPDLAFRLYQGVSNLEVARYQGDAEPLPTVSITDNTIEHLDTNHDGFYSIAFDPVPGATGILIEWANEGPNKHWTIREIEAYAQTQGPQDIRLTDVSFNENGKPVVTWESQPGAKYAVELSFDLIDWPELKDNIVGEAGTTSFVHENFVAGPTVLFFRVRAKP